MASNKIKIEISDGVEISITMQKIISGLNQKQLDLLAKMIQDEPKRRKDLEKFLQEQEFNRSRYGGLP